jgi:predicted dehydrogenase
MVTRTPGSHNFAAAFHAVPQTEIVGIFDLGAETREAFVDCWRDVWGKVPTYDDFRQMLDDLDPDIVCISTRQTMHAEQVEWAVRGGARAVLCDKPLATSLAEMDRILAACRDVPLLLALDRRWSSRYVSLRRLLSDGKIGEVKSVVSYGLANLIHHGCHWYDTLLALAGDVEPAWVSGFVDDVSGDPPDSRRRLDPSGRGQIGLENGVVLYVTADGRHPGAAGPSFEVVGENGRLFLLDDARESYIWLPEGETKMRAIPLPEETDPWPAGPAMVRDLLQGVQTGGRTSCDVARARRSTEIGFAIHTSSLRDGVRVALPVEDRSLRVESLPWGNE